MKETTAMEKIIEVSIKTLKQFTVIITIGLIAETAARYPAECSAWRNIYEKNENDNQVVVVDR